MVARLKVGQSKNLLPLSDLKPLCWRCADTGFQPVKDAEGIDRMRLCLCRRRRMMRALKVPPVFGRPVLGRLRARRYRHPKQAAVIKLLQEAPASSYLIAGKNGSGKTHFSWALCRAALIRGNRVRAVLLSELIGQYQALAIEDGSEATNRPAVNPDDLKQGINYTIFLDEFDKVKTTEFATRKLFELLNAVRDFEHQLLVTSNREWSELREVWSKVDEVYGNSIMTRLQGCTLIEMF